MKLEKSRSPVSVGGNVANSRFPLRESPLSRSRASASAGNNVLARRRLRHAFYYRVVYLREGIIAEINAGFHYADDFVYNI